MHWTRRPCGAWIPSNLENGVKDVSVYYALKTWVKSRTYFRLYFRKHRKKHPLGPIGFWCLRACLNAKDLKKPSYFHVDLHPAHKSTVVRDLLLKKERRLSLSLGTFKNKAVKSFSPPFKRKFCGFFLPTYKLKKGCFENV